MKKWAERDGIPLETFIPIFFFIVLKSMGDFPMTRIRIYFTHTETPQ